MASCSIKSPEAGVAEEFEDDDEEEFVYQPQAEEDGGDDAEYHEDQENDENVLQPHMVPLPLSVPVRIPLHMKRWSFSQMSYPTRQPLRILLASAKLS
jgi:hypothetical protein